MPVEIFLEGYGTAKMDAAAEVVTENFRDDKPASVWVYDTWTSLDNLEYERLENEIVESAIEGDQAIVQVHTTIITVAGEVEQDELYHLIQQDDDWLIEDMRVTNEKVEEALNKL